MASSKFLSLVYHDIFEYPLTEKELQKWEVGSLPAQAGEKVLALRRGAMNVDREVRNKIKRTKGYYHFKGRASIVKLRKIRENESVKKLKLARKISTKLSTIPTIRFIGVTGSLAMGNAKEDSDIDLMIITTSGMLWTTRIIVRIVTKLQSYKVRQVGENEVKNAICSNMWLDEKHLVIPSKMRNLYSAHEVLQVVPLYNKDHTFEKFLDANKWALEFWPNAGKDIEILRYRDTKGKFSKYLSILVSKYLRILERLAYSLQKIYMHKKRTRELIQPGRALFHPIDWSKYVMREFDKRVDENYLYKARAG